MRGLGIILVLAPLSQGTPFNHRGHHTHGMECKGDVIFLWRLLGNQENEGLTYSFYLYIACIAYRNQVHLKSDS